MEKYHKFQTKPTTDEIKVTLQTTWQELAQEHDNRALANFTKHLAANSSYFRLTQFMVCDQSSPVGLCMQNYKFLCAVVNTETNTDTDSF